MIVVDIARLTICSMGAIASGKARYDSTLFAPPPRETCHDPAQLQNLRHQIRLARRQAPLALGYRSFKRRFCINLNVSTTRRAVNLALYFAVKIWRFFTQASTTFRQNASRASRQIASNILFCMAFRQTSKAAPRLRSTCRFTPPQSRRTIPSAALWPLAAAVDQAQWV